MSEARNKQALDLVYNLGDQVFGAQKRLAEGQYRSQAEGIIEKLPIYTWPSGVSNDDKLAVLAYLTAFGQTEDDSPRAWSCWAFSYLVLCFPEFQQAIGRINSREYEFVKLPVEYIHFIVQVSHRAEEREGSGEDREYNQMASQIPVLANFPDVRPSATSYPPELAACELVTAVYGYAALIIYLCGKKINEKNSVAITDKRPQNLIDTYKIDEQAAYILKGEGAMSSAAHAFVNQAWVTHAAVRAGIITEVATFAGGATLPQRVVYTVAKMLENSGMQPAYFIHRFLQAFPRCASYSCIRPALNAYASSIREVAAAPPHIQPYYKLIQGEGTRAFHRNSILMLSSCAVAYEKYTSPSMRNFNLGEGATIALAMFDAEATRNGHPTLQSLTFARDGEETSAE